LTADFGGGDGEGAGDVEGVFGAEEGDFEDVVGCRERLGGDAVFFIAEDEGESGGKEEFGDGNGVVAGVEGDEGAGQGSERDVLETGDEACCAHSGVLDFFVIDEGCFFREINFAGAKSFRGPEDASDIVGGADIVEIDGNVAEIAFGNMISCPNVGEEVVFFQRKTCLAEVPMISVGEKFQVG